MAEGSEKVDKWRYAVALAKFVVHVLYPGMTNAMSVLIPSLVFQLELDYTTVGFLVPMQFGVFYLACPLSNYLSTKFGHRCVSTISGFLSGVSLMGAFFSQSALSLGCSLFFTGLFSSPLLQTSTVILHEHFGETFGMATTFTQLGGPFGGIILPYITALCLDAYGLRGTLLCLSGIFFYPTAIGATMRSPRQYSTAKMKRRNHQTTDDEDSRLIQGERSRNEEICLQNREIGANPKTNDESNVEGFISKDAETQRSKATWTLIVDFVSSILALGFLKKERVFTFLFIPCYLLGEISYVIWMTFSVSYGVSVGLTENEAVYLPMVGSLGGFIGRMMLIGILYKHPYLSPHMFPVNTAISSIALFAYPISSSLRHLLVCSFFAGFGFNGSISSFYAAVGLNMKKTDFPITMAIVFLLSGVVFLLSGTLAGLFYELLRSFKVIFLATGAFLAITCGLFSGYLFNDARLKRRSSTYKR